MFDQALLWFLIRQKNAGCRRVLHRRNTAGGSVIHPSAGQLVGAEAAFARLCVGRPHWRTRPLNAQSPLAARYRHSQLARCRERRDVSLRRRLSLRLSSRLLSSKLSASTAPLALHSYT